MFSGGKHAREESKAAASATLTAVMRQAERELSEERERLRSQYVAAALSGLIARGYVRGCDNSWILAEAHRIGTAMLEARGK